MGGDQDPEGSKVAVLSMGTGGGVRERRHCEGSARQGHERITERATDERTSEYDPTVEMANRRPPRPIEVPSVRKEAAQFWCVYA